MLVKVNLPSWVKIAPHSLYFFFFVPSVAALLCLITGEVILHLMKLHLHFLHPTITFSRPSPILEYFWKNSTPCLPSQIMHIRKEDNQSETANSKSNKKNFFLSTV